MAGCGGGIGFSNSFFSSMNSWAKSHGAIPGQAGWNESFLSFLQSSEAKGSGMSQKVYVQKG